MKKLFDTSLALITLAIFVNACAPYKSSQLQNESIDASLAKYLNEFESQALKRGAILDVSHLVMVFSETMPKGDIAGATTLAFCKRDSINGPTVTVKGSYFKTANVTRRESIIFHELGHCLLNLEHINTTEVAFWHNSNNPASIVSSSIMNELQFDSNLYSGNRATYLDRLFGVSTNALLYWNAPSQLDSNFYD